MLRFRPFVLVLLLAALPVFAQQATSWHDPSPHKAQFVTVDKDVKLEVLDWGGTGRPIVLLAGLGNTAHVFDDFAPKLTSEYHVYGITRRGYGASSAPTTGYAADRLGDDVVAVLDALRLEDPVLVGHSMAGEELSSVATRHPDRIAGLIYLDASYWSAYYYRSMGTLTIDLEELLKKLGKLQPGENPPDRSQLVQALLGEDLPAFEEDLRDWQASSQSAPVQPAPPPMPAPADLASFPAFRSWYMRITGITYPEAEFRQIRESRSDGGVGKYNYQSSDLAVMRGQQKYSNIRITSLAICALPHDWGPTVSSDPIGREIARGVDDAEEQQTKALETGAPSVRVVRLPHANHYLFISNEADVLREMRAFLASLH